MKILNLGDGLPFEVKHIVRPLLDQAWDVVRARAEEQRLRVEEQERARLQTIEDKKRDLVARWREALKGGE